MIQTEDFFKFLIKENVDFFTGVPDSLLKDLCQYIHENTSKEQHIIAANEGNSIALAAGHYLSSNKIPLVYLQNSGFGNAINPLLSLASKAVYSVPMIIFVGWRGEPGVKDEPQHMLQGEIMINLLKSCKLKYDILPQNLEESREKIINALNIIKKIPEPFVFLVKKNSFTKYKSKNPSRNKYKLLRREAIEIIASQLLDDDILLGTTGKISREIYQARQEIYNSHKMDFLNVGAMGHLNQVALMVAKNNPDRRVVCLDGDGSILMHLGGLAILGSHRPKNLKHIILNNGCHESVGGQPTVGFDMNITKIASNLGYDFSQKLESKEDILCNIHDILNNNKLSLIEIRVGVEENKDLIRPDNNFIKHKERFMNYNLDIIKKYYIGNKSFNNLYNILSKNKSKNIFIVTGKSSFEVQFKKLFSKIEDGFNVKYFNDFSSNFDEKILLNALNIFNKEKYDTIIAIGGGSVIDMAKMIRLFSNNDIKISDLLDKKISKNINNQQKLIAIPTTSGSGSENTKFSVLYKGDKKFSVEHESMLPNHIILDHELKYNLDNKNAIASGLDAFCQAIESLWSVNSNEQSRSYSIYAIKLILSNLTSAVNNNNNEAKDKISLASFYAGKAINISKTTISHALSYPITKHYNIAHGISVAITIIELLKYNLSEKNKENLIDPRGLSYHQNIIKIFLKTFNAKNIEEICDKIKEIFLEVGFYSLVPKKLDEKLITRDLNQARLKNNPLGINEKELKNLINNSINYR